MTSHLTRLPLSVLLYIHVSLYSVRTGTRTVPGTWYSTLPVANRERSHPPVAYRYRTSSTRPTGTCTSTVSPTGLRIYRYKYLVVTTLSVAPGTITMCRLLIRSFRPIFLFCLLWGIMLVQSQDDEESSSPSPPMTTSSSSNTITGAGIKVDAGEFDDRTLLDTFGEAAKQYLTQKVIPETDPECKWDWRTVRCEPFCQCAFSPKRGDYHLGRSCRLAEKEDCDPIESVPEANSLQLVIQRMVQGSSKVLGTAEQATKTGYRKIQSSVCEGMPEIQCTESGKLPVIAWQERLFCHHRIPTCEVSSHASSTSSDGE